MHPRKRPLQSVSLKKQVTGSPSKPTKPAKKKCTYCKICNIKYPTPSQYAKHRSTTHQEKVAAKYTITLEPLVHEHRPLLRQPDDRFVCEWNLVEGLPPSAKYQCRYTTVCGMRMSAHVGRHLPGLRLSSVEEDSALGEDDGALDEDEDMDDPIASFSTSTPLYNPALPAPSHSIAEPYNSTLQTPTDAETLAFLASLVVDNQAPGIPPNAPSLAQLVDDSMAFGYVPQAAPDPQLWLGGPQFISDIPMDVPNTIVQPQGWMDPSHFIGPSIPLSLPSFDDDTSPVPQNPQPPARADPTFSDAMYEEWDISQEYLANLDISHHAQPPPVLQPAVLPSVTPQVQPTSPQPHVGAPTLDPQGAPLVGQRPLPSQAHSAVDPVLDFGNELLDAGVILHRPLLALICQTCQVGLRPSQIVHHMQHSHEHVVPQSLVKRIVETYGLPHDPPLHPFDVLPIYKHYSEGELHRPIPLLRRTPGYLCIVHGCNYACAEQSSIQKHAAKHIKDGNLGESRGKPPYRSCLSVQRLLDENQSPYFPVNEDLEDLPPDSAYEAFLALQLRTQPPPRTHLPSETDSRRDSIFLNKAGWLTALHGAPIQELVDLTEKPGMGEGAVQRVYQCIRDAGPSLAELVRGTMHRDKLSLRWMVSTQMGQVTKLTFQPPNPDSMVSYAHSGAKLITMLLRISAKVPYPYVLITEPERAALLALLQAAQDSRTSEDSLWEAVVAVVMAILRAAVDPSGSNPAAPLVHYVMISNLKRDGSFTEPAGITSPVAGLEWWLRAAFFHWATHEALKQSKPTYQIIRENHYLLCDGEPHALTGLYDIQALATTYARSMHSLPTTRFADGKLWFKGISFTFPAFVQHARTMQERLRELMKEALFGYEASDFLDCSVKDSHDNWSDRSPDYSFLTDPNNRYVAARGLLMKRVLSKPALAAEFGTRDEANNLVPNRIRIQRYVDLHDHIVTLLFTIMQVEGGQGRRGSEVAGTLLVNGTKGMFRSLINYHGRHLASFLTYHKGQERTGHTKETLHFFPSDTAETIIAFIVLVRWTVVDLLRTIGEYGSADTYSLYLFAHRGRVPDTSTLSGWLQFHLADLGPHIGLNPLRHITTALHRHFLEAVVDGVTMHSDRDMAFDYESDVPISHGVENIGDLQAAHTTQVAQQKYAVESNNPNALDHVTMPAYLKYCESWHCLLRGSEMTQAALPGNNCIQQQHVIGKGDNTTSHQQHHDIVSRIERLQRTVEQGNHEVTQHVIGSVHVLERLARPPMASALAAPYINLPVSPELLRNVRSYMDRPGLQWTSPQQAQAVALVLKRGSDVLIVLECGAGKSLAYEYPVFAERDSGLVSVVILPYRSVRADTFERCWNRGLGVDLFNEHDDYVQDVIAGGDVPRRINLFVLLVDQLLASKTLQFFMAIASRNLLARVIIDECHLPLGEKYRPAWDHVNVLRAAGPDLVMLSGSLSPDSTQALLTMMTAPFANIVRALTTPRKHAFHVVKAGDAEDMDRKFYRHLEHIIAALQPCEQVVVFCRGKGQAEAMYQRLDQESSANPVFRPGMFGLHTGKMDVKREPDLGNFLSGRIAVLIATTAAHHGLDCPNIILTLHYDVPYSISALVQGTRRALRGTTAVGDTFIYYHNLPSTPILHTAVDHMGAGAISHFLTTTGCRLAVIVSCWVDLPQRLPPLEFQMVFEPDRCPHCQTVYLLPFCATPPSIPSVSSQSSSPASRKFGPPTHARKPLAGKAPVVLVPSTSQATPEVMVTIAVNSQRYSQSSSQEQKEARKLMDWLHRMRDQCPFCWALGGQLESHTWQHCARTSTTGAPLSVETCLKKHHINHEKGAGSCFSCHSPPILDDNAHDNSKSRKQGEACRYPGLLKEAFWAILDSQELCDRVIEVFPQLLDPAHRNIVAGQISKHFHILARVVLWRIDDLANQ